jgi:glutathione S-transferase
MKLFFVPGTCSLVPSIVMRELGVPFEHDRVDVRNGKKTDGGEDYLKLNPKGFVPALRLDSGRVMTECAVIVQYLADQHPSAKLAPANGTMERVDLQEWLNFCATELHKGMSIFYQPTAGEELRAVFRGRLTHRFGLLGDAVAKTGYLVGDQFTVADAYAFYVCWAYQRVVKGTLEGPLAAYYAKLATRPSIKAALEAEKLES